MPAVRRIVFPQGGPSFPLITTNSLPPGVVGTPYSFQMQAAGGLPPYTWQLTASSAAWLTCTAGGLLGGTPTASGILSATLKVTDSVAAPSPPISFNFSVSGVGGTAPGPQALWLGHVDSFSMTLALWPSTNGGLGASYNAYRVDISSTIPAQTNIVASANTTPQFGVSDWDGKRWVGGPSPGTAQSFIAGQTYRYFFTEVIGGVESQPSNTISITALAAGPGATAPNPTTGPATYAPAYAFPTAGQIYVADATTPTGPPVWPADVPPNFNNGNFHSGCSIHYAFANAVAGDAIILDTVTYTSGTSPAFTAPAVAGPGYLYICSKQDPGIPPSVAQQIAGAGGKLIAQSLLTYPQWGFTGVPLASLPAAGAITATLSAPWNFRTGYFPTHFITTNPANIEQRYVHFTQGSTAINWSAQLANISGAGVANAYSPLQGNVTDTILRVLIGNMVTPDDKANLATLQFNLTQNGGLGLTVPGSSSFIRFVGLNITPAPNIPINQTCVQCVTAAGHDHFFDRCVFGNDSTLPGFTTCIRGVQGSGANILAQQCFMYGFSDASGQGGTILTLGTLTPGSGYTPGTYNNVHLNPVSGAGNSATANIVINASGQVSSVTLVGGGFKFGVGQQVTTPAAALGGTGSGFQIAVATVSGSSSNTGDTQGWFHQSGGPQAVRNCVIEATSECILSGGVYTGQASVPHDGWYQYNYISKNGAWNGGVLGWECKNLIELKIGLRYTFDSNIFGGVWSGSAGNGQFGRVFQIGTIDEAAGQGTRPLSGSWSSAGGGTVTATATNLAFGIAVGTEFVVTVAGALAGYNGTFVATVTGTNTFTYQLTTNPGGALSGHMNNITQAINPWTHTNDIIITNNQLYACGSAVHFYDSNGDQLAGAMARGTFSNNLIWINPLGTDHVGTTTVGRALNGRGHTPDVTMDHNTVVIIPQSQPGVPSGYLTVPAATNAQFTSGMEMYSAPPAPAGGLQPLTDRWVITNNLLDGFHAFDVIPFSGSGGANGSGASFLNQQFKNVTWSNNSMLLDATTGWPGTNNFNTSYAATFTNFQGNRVMPLSPAYWNVTQGPAFTGDSSGGPQGSKFIGTLQSDFFPRTIVNFIGGNPERSLSGNVPGANVTFSTAVAQSSAVVLGYFLGFEGAHSVNTANLISGWKSAATANGVTLRALMYTPGLAPKTVSGAGVGGTGGWLANAFNASNMWCYTANAAGGGTGGSNQMSYNGYLPNQAVVLWTPGSVQTVASFTYQGKTGVNVGLNVWSVYSQYWYDVYIAGLANSKYGDGAAAVNSQLDGFELDNCGFGNLNNFVASGVGTWQGYNTTPVPSGGVTGAQVIALIQQGTAKQVAAFRALKPGIILFGNAGLSSGEAVDSSYVGAWDIMFNEEVIGQSYSIETSSFMNGAFMTQLIADEAIVAPGGTLLFHMDGGPGGTNLFVSGGVPINQSSWTATMWQAARYGFAAAMMRDWHFSLNVGQQQYSTVALFDEQVQGGNYGWLSAGTQRFDPPQSAAWSNGVWRRRFPNGWVLWSPRTQATWPGTNTKTVTVPTTLFRIASRGFGDATVNSGAQVTGGSITLRDGDGIFLIGTG